MEDIKKRFEDLEERITRLEATMIHYLEIGQSINEATARRLEQAGATFNAILQQMRSVQETIEGYQATATAPVGSA